MQTVVTNNAGKDGGFAISSSGIVKKAAAAFTVNLTCPKYKWFGKGLRHRIGLALACELERCIVVVRSDETEIHVLTHAAATSGRVFATYPADLIRLLLKSSKSFSTLANMDFKSDSEELQSLGGIAEEPGMPK